MGTAPNVYAESCAVLWLTVVSVRKKGRRHRIFVQVCLHTSNDQASGNTSEVVPYLRTLQTPIWIL